MVRWFALLVLSIFLLARPTLAAITQVGAGSTAAGSGASAVLTKPTGIAVGDVMLAQITVRGGTLVAITPPGGWALVPTGGRANSGTALAQAIYYKVAVAADVTATNYTFSFTSGRYATGIVAYRGVDVAAPINASASQVNAASTNITAPSITTTVPTTQLVGFFGIAYADTLTPPGTLAEKFIANSGGGPNGAGIVAGDQAQAATGATGTRVATGTQSRVNIGHLVALKSARTFLVETLGGGNILTQIAGTSFAIRITALNPNGTTDTTFTGTVTITSTGTLSLGSGTTAAFTAGVLTSHTVRIANAGTFTITATDASANTGASNSFSVAPLLVILAPGESLAVGVGKTGSPTNQTAGVAFSMTVYAVNEDWSVDTTSIDTITLSSSDGSATLPGPAALVAGTQTFSVTLATPPSQTVTASATAPTRSSTSSSIPLAVAGGRFNACDTGATCTDATPSTYIQTKVAGVNFNLDLVAVNTDGTRNTGYTNSVSVELLDASDNSAALDADNCRNSWTIIATLSPNPTFVSNGLVNAGPFNVANAYREVRVRVSQAAPPRKGCSTDNFAIRPQRLVLAATNNDWETAGTTNSLANTAASAGVIHKAGRNFTLTANAWNGAGTPAVTTNYTGTPAMTLSACGGASCTASFGTLAPGVTSFTAGNLTSNTATYNDVGAFNLKLEDTDFASVDAADGTPADCSATGRYVCSAATAVGRFVPNHLETDFSAGGPMNCGALVFAPPCPSGNLTYSGQAFTLRVRAYALGGTGGAGLTANYAGAIAKDVTLTAWDAIGSTTLQNPPASGGTLTGNSVPAANFTAGVATASPVYRFTANPTAPTNVYFRAIDAESVSSLNAIPASVEGGIKVVSGRMQIENMYGTPTARLATKVRTLYWSGTQWSLNTSDAASGSATGNFLLGNAGTCVSPTFCGITLLSAALLGAGGEFRLTLTPPTSGSGRRSVVLNSALSYLSGSGRQTWGSFRAPYIYQQER